jgi:hypothetical protein
MAMMQNQRPEKMKQDMAKNGQLGDLWLSLRERKTLDKLLESAKDRRHRGQGGRPMPSDSPEAKDPSDASDAAASSDATDLLNREDAQARAQHDARRARCVERRLFRSMSLSLMPHADHERDAHDYERHTWLIKDPSP